MNSAQEMQHKIRAYWAIPRATAYDGHIEQSFYLIEYVNQISSQMVFKFTLSKLG